MGIEDPKKGGVSIGVHVRISFDKNSGPIFETALCLQRLIYLPSRAVNWLLQEVDSPVTATEGN
jgi:hypothetical protein